MRGKQKDKERNIYTKTHVQKSKRMEMPGKNEQLKEIRTTRRRKTEVVKKMKNDKNLHIIKKLKMCDEKS